jgi:NADPH:quinone reductase-like Zn-dependent oxidoreductase
MGNELLSLTLLTVCRWIGYRWCIHFFQGATESMALPQTFNAMVVSETAEKTFVREIKQRALSDLPAGELVIEVKYSSLNYKDALSASGNKGVTRKYPHTPGIDAAGVVATSTTRLFAVGDQVTVTACRRCGRPKCRRRCRCATAWVMALRD